MKKVISIIITILICFSLIGCGSEEKKPKSFHELEENEKYSLVMKIGEDYTKEQLKNPDEADFDLPTVKTLSDGKTFELSGLVKAHNSFGIKLKQPYSMKIRFPKDDTYGVEDTYYYEISEFQIKK